VIWRSTFARLSSARAGLEVVARGRVTTYPDKSKYQIVIDALSPRRRRVDGAARQRKKMLAAQPVRRRAQKALPYLPRIVGWSPRHRRDPTSCSGWAIASPLRSGVAGQVQGETCAPGCPAIAGFNTLRSRHDPAPRPDYRRARACFEDLWGFNEEIVARAVAASAIPVARRSATRPTGRHRSRCRLRAPTPIAAAEPPCRCAPTCSSR
jgi:exodeoxyribonuclease VII large subunit